MPEMSEKQYSYRYYDGLAAFIHPEPRDEVLARMRRDLSVVPVERIRLHHGGWGPWVDSDELLRSDVLGGAGEAQEEG